MKKKEPKAGEKTKIKKQSKSSAIAGKTGKTKKLAQKPAKSAKGPSKKKATLPSKPSAKKTAAKKVRKKPTKETSIPKKKIGVPRKTIKKIAVKIKQAEVGQTYQEISYGIGLPQEYGEDRISLMVVEPWKLFTYWEAREDTLAKLKGQLVIRVYDVTGKYFDGKNANIVFDIPAYGRIGDTYIGVAPNKEFIVDLGMLLKKGEFKKIARSNKAATPATEISMAGGVLPQEIYEAERVGYFLG